jgi:hypothetical protein
LSSEKGVARVYALALLPAFCYEEKSVQGAATLMNHYSWSYAGFFFGFTGYFCRPARGLVC